MHRLNSHLKTLHQQVHGDYQLHDACEAARIVCDPSSDSAQDYKGNRFFHRSFAVALGNQEITLALVQDKQNQVVNLFVCGDVVPETSLLQTKRKWVPHPRFAQSCPKDAAVHAGVLKWFEAAEQRAYDAIRELDFSRIIFSGSRWCGVLAILLGTGYCERFGKVPTAVYTFNSPTFATSSFLGHLDVCGVGKITWRHRLWSDTDKATGRLQTRFKLHPGQYVFLCPDGLWINPDEDLTTQLESSVQSSGGKYESGQPHPEGYYEHLMNARAACSIRNLRIAEVTLASIKIEWDHADLSPLLPRPTHTVLIRPLASKSPPTPIRPVTPLPLAASHTCLAQRLSPGTEYELTVKSGNGEVLEAFGSSIHAIPTANIGIATVLQVTSISLIVEWDLVESAEKYKVELRKLEDKDSKFIVLSEDLTTSCEGPTPSRDRTMLYEVLNLAPGTTYQVRICPGTTYGYLADSFNNVTVTTVPQVPLEPPPRTVSVTADAIQIAWNTAQGASHYHVRYRKSHGGDSFKMVKAETGTSCTLQHLETSTEYDLQVLAASTDGIEESEFVMSAFTLSPVDKLTVESTSFSEAVLTWKAPASPKGCHYLVSLKSRGTDSLEETVVDGVMATPDDKGFVQCLCDKLTAGTSYIGTVYVGYGPLKESVGSSVSFATLMTPPSGFEIRDFDDHSVRLQWNAHEIASQYMLTRVLGDGSEAVLVERITECETEIGGLEAGSNYEFRLYAGKHAVLSESFRTVAMTPLHRIRDVQLTRLDHNSVTLTVESVHGADGYCVEYQPVEGPDIWVQGYLGPSTEIYIDGLEPGVSYHMRIGAVSREICQQNVISRTYTPIGPPTDFRPITLLDTSVTLEWTCPHNVHLRYTEQGQPSDQSWIHDINGSSTVVPNLRPNVTYMFELYASKDSRETSGTSVSITTLSKVLDLDVSAVTENSAIITFTPVRAATLYRVMQKVDQGAASAFVQVYEGNEQEIHMRNLQAGKRVTWRVIPGTSLGFADHFGEVTAITLGRVSSLEVSDLTCQSATVRWSAVPGATSYKVVVSRADTEETQTVLSRTTSDSECILEALFPDILYRVEVTAGSENNFSSLSEQSEVMLLGTVEGAVVTFLNDKSAIVQWKPVAHARRYKIVFEGGPQEPLTTVGTQVVLENLSPGTRYTCRIHAALDHEFQTDFDTVCFTPLAPVDRLQIMSISNGAVTLQWESESSVRIQKKPHGTPDSEYETVALRSSGSSTLNHFRVSGLKNEVCYDFRLFAGVDGVFETVGRSCQATAILPLAGTRIIALSDTWVDLEWLAVKGASRYQISLQPLEGNTNAPIGELSVVAEISETNHRVSYLASGTTYYIAIKAGTSTAWSEESATVNVMCLKSAITLGGIAISHLDSTSAKLFWPEIEGAEKYRVQRRIHGDPDAPMETLFESLSQPGAFIEDLATDVTYDLFIAGASSLHSDVFQSNAGELTLTTLHHVQNTRILSLGKTAVTVGWDHVSQGLVKIVVWPENGFHSMGSVVADGLSTTSHTITGLLPSTKYRLRVQIGKYGVYETVGSEISFTSLPAPEDLEITALSATGISLRWEQVHLAEKYCIRWQNHSTDGSGEWHDAILRDVCAHTLDGLQDDVTITVEVIAGLECKDSEGNGSTIFSEDVARIVATPLVPVDSLSCSSVTDSTITLSWYFAAMDCCAKLELRESGTSAWKCIVSDHKAQSLTVQNLIVATQYDVRVSTGKHGVYETVGALVEGITLLSNVTAVRILAVSETTVTLEWDEVPGACRYRIQSITSGCWIEDVEGYSHVCEGLTSGEVYQFMVCAGNAHCYSSVGTAISAIPLEAVKGLRVVSLSGEEAAIEWQAVVGASVYIVDVSGRERMIIEGTSFSVHGLLVGVEVQLQIAAAHTASTQSTAMTQLSFTPVDCVSDLLIKEVTETTVLLDWSGPYSVKIEMRSVDTNDSFLENVVSNYGQKHICIEGLSEGLSYMFRVFSGVNDIYETIGNTIIGTPLGRIQDLNVQSIADSTVSLKWKKMERASRYRVMQSLSADSAQEAMVLTDSITDPEYEVGLLTAGASYRLSVFAGTATGFSALPATVIVIPLATIKIDNSLRKALKWTTSHDISRNPETLNDTDHTHGLRILSMTGKSIRFGWPPVSGAEEYVVRSSTSDRNGQSHSIVEDHVSSSTTFDIGYLKTGVPYEFEFASKSEWGVQSNSIRVPIVTSDPVANFRVDGVDSSSITLAWACPESVSVTVQQKLFSQPDTTFQEIASNIRAKSLTVRHLSTAQEYTFRAFASSSNSVHETIGATVSSRPLLPVNNFRCVRFDSMSVELEWEPSEYATRFKLEQIMVESSTENVSPTFGIFSRPRAVVEGLTAGATYRFLVSSGTENEFSMETQHVQVTCLETPGNIEIVSLNNTAAIVRWGAVAGAQGYYLEQRVVSGAPHTDLLMTPRDSAMIKSDYTMLYNNLTQPSVNIRWLQEGLSYHFRLYAVGEAGLQSNFSSFKLAPMSPIKSLEVLRFANDCAELHWESEYGVRLELEWSQNPGQRTLLANMSATTKSYTVHGLTPGELYTIHGYSAAASGVFETVGQCVKVMVVESPAELEVKKILASQVTIDWTPAEFATCYKISLGVDGETISELENISPSETQGFEIFDLVPGVIYRVAVSSGTDFGYSSEYIEIHTASLVTPRHGLQIDHLTSSSCAISWDAVEASERYCVTGKQGSSGEDWYVIADHLEEPCVTVSGLLVGEVLQLRIAGGLNGILQSNPATIEFTPLEPPAELRVGSVTRNTATISWECESQVMLELQRIRRHMRQEAEWEVVAEELLIAGDSSYELGSLDPGTKYILRARAGLNSVYETIGTELFITPLNPIENFRIIEIWDSAVKVGWEFIPGASSFRITLRERAQGAMPVLVGDLSGSSQTFTIKDLVVGTFYEVAIFAGSTTAFSREGMVLITTPLPSLAIAALTHASLQYVKSINMTVGDPVKTAIKQIVSSRNDINSASGIRVVSLTSSSIGLQWSSVVGAVRYKVEVQRTDLQDEFRLIADDIEAPWHELTDLDPDQTYTIRVAAGSETVFQSNFVILEVRTLSTVQQMRVKWVGQTSFEVCWKLSSVSDSTVDIQMKLADQNPDAYRSITKAKGFESIVVQNLEVGTTYNLLVNVGCGGIYETVGEVISITTLPSVESLVATEITATSLTLSWASAPPCNMYRVLQSVTNGNPALETTRPRDGIIDSHVALQNLLTGVPYNLSVFSGINDVYSSEGVSISVTPLHPPDFEILHVTDSSVMFRFLCDASEEVSVQFKQSKEHTPWELVDTLVCSGSATSDIPGLDVGACYSIRICRGVQDCFETVGVIASCTPVQQVSDVHIEQLGSDFAVIVWDPAVGATSYRVAVERESGERLAEDIISQETYRFGQLESGVRYIFKVWSGCDGLFHSLFDFADAIPLPCVNPSTVSVVSNTSRTICLEWEAVSGAVFYDIEKKRCGAEDAKYETVCTDSPEPRVTIDHLEPNQTYTVKITAGTEFEYETFGATRDVTPLIPPTALRLTNLGDSDVTVAWDCKFQAQLEIKALQTQGGSDRIVVARDISEKDYVLTGLTLCESYNLLVRHGFDGEYEDEGTELNFTTLPQLTGLTVTSLTSSQVDIHWNPVETAETYVVQISNESGDTVTDVVTSGTSYRITDLVAGVVHTLSVQAKKEYVSQYAAECQFCPLDAVTPRISGVTDSTITVEWDEVPGAESYRIEYRPLQSEEWTLLDIGLTDLSTIVAELDQEKTYEVRVLAEAFGILQVNYVSVSATPLGNVHGLRVETLLSDHVELQWTEVTGAEAYLVRLVSDVQGEIEIETEITDSKFVKHGLQSGKRYSFQVCARKEVCSQNIAVVHFTPMESPVLSISDILEKSVSITWAPVKGAECYRVRYKESSGAEESPDLERGAWVEAGDTTETEIRVGSLFSSTTYRIEVTAKACAVLQSNCTHLLATPLPNIQGLVVDTLSDHLVSVSWKPVDGATAYIAEVMLGEQQISAEELTSCMVSLSDLAIGQMHVLSIRARREAIARHTTTLSFTPLSRPMLMVDRIDSKSVGLKWDQVYGAESYQIRCMLREESNSLESQWRLVCAECEGAFVRVSDLLPDSTYIFEVAARANSITQSNHTTIDATPTSVAVCPTVTAVSQDSVRLEWSSPTPVTIHCRPLSSEDEEFSLAIESATDFCKVGGLLESLQYEFHLYRYSLEGIVESEGCMISAATIPSPEVAITTVSQSSVTLSWSELPFTSYYLIRNISNGVEQLIDGTEVEIENLAPGFEYSITVCGCLENGASSDSHALISATPLSMPNARIAVLSATSVTIEWDTVEAEVFRVKYRTATSASQDFEEYASDITGTSVTLTDLQPWVPLDVEICPGTLQYWSSDSVCLSLTPLPPVTNLELVQVSGSSVQLRWDQAPTRAIEYSVTFTPTTRLDADTSAETVCVSESSCHLEGLHQGTQYSVRVVAGIDGCFETAGSTLSARPIGVTTDLKIASVSSTSISIAWSPVEYASDYEVSLAVVGQHNFFDESALVEVYQKFDADGSGSITADELAQVMQELDVQLSPIHLNKFMADGSIDFDEFLTLFRMNKKALYRKSVDKLAAWVQSEATVLEASFVPTSTTGDCSFEFQNLMIGVEYAVGVRSRISGVAHTGLSSIKAICVQCPMMKLNDLNDHSARLSWDFALGSTKYRFKYHHLLNGQEVLLKDYETPDSSMVVDGLVVDQRYKFCVVPGYECASGTVWSSDAVEVTVSPLSPVEDLVMESISPTEVSLSWTARKGATKFKVSRAIRSSIEKLQNPPIWKEIGVCQDTHFSEVGKYAGLVSYRIAAGNDLGMFETGTLVEGFVLPKGDASAQFMKQVFTLDAEYPGLLSTCKKDAEGKYSIGGKKVNTQMVNSELKVKTGSGFSTIAGFLTKNERAVRQHLEELALATAEKSMRRPSLVKRSSLQRM